MRTDSIKKYVIPNIPYLFILWACLKLGTAYRLAPGADFAHKLMGLGQSIGPAFADFVPGLNPIDWLIGMVGAVGFRLLIYIKSKNAKKFRRDEEYGSARWRAFPCASQRACVRPLPPWRLLCVFWFCRRYCAFCPAWTCCASFCPEM